MSYKFLIIFLCGISLSLLATNQDEKPLIEKMVVQNIEVPVRVMDENDNPISDLSKEDFKLFENGKLRSINGFFLKRKKIRQTITIPGEAIVDSKPQIVPRTFVLAFQLTDFNEDVEKAIAHLFTNVLTQGDRVLIFSRNLAIDTVIQETNEQLVENLQTELRKECIKVKVRLNMLFRKLDDLLNESIEDWNKVNRYLLLWDQYKNEYLLPDTRTFYRLAHYLKNTKGLKWVLNFYQFEHYPKLKRDSKLFQYMSGARNALQFEYINAFDLTKDDFPVEAISKLFSTVDTTFHSFFIKRSRDEPHQDLSYERVSDELEQTLFSVTRLTGGKNMVSNKLIESLEQVVELEDAYYILTYVPAKAEKAGKIKVQVDRKNVRVFYDDQFQPDFIKSVSEQIEQEMSVKQIKITDFDTQSDGISFVIRGCQAQTQTLFVRVRLLSGSDGVHYDQIKEVRAYQNSISFHLPIFSGLTAGEYRVIIEVEDKSSGQRDTLYRSVTITGH